MKSFFPRFSEFFFFWKMEIYRFASFLSVLGSNLDRLKNFAACSAV